MIVFEPAQERRPKIEANAFVIVDRLRRAGSGIGNYRERIWLIAFCVNALVPIVKGSGAWLFLHDSGPWIFAWRLIEVAMDNERRHGSIKTQATKRHKGRADQSEVGLGLLC